MNNMLSDLYLLVEQYPYDAQHYSALFTILKETDDSEGGIMCDDLTNSHLLLFSIKVQLHELRNQYVSRFHPDLQFWQEWLSEVASSKQAKHREIFDLALSQCPEYNVISLFLDFVNDLVDADVKVIFGTLFKQARLILVVVSFRMRST
jgi:hypothetical protein